MQAFGDWNVYLRKRNPKYDAAMTDSEYSDEETPKSSRKRAAAPLPSPVKLTKKRLNYADVT